MSTPEPLDGPVPAWRPAALPAVPTPPAPTPAPMPSPAPSSWEEEPASRTIGPRTVLRAALRHWWQILLLWAVGSAAVVWLVYTQVNPTFEAFAILRVEEPIPKVFKDDVGGSRNMATQAALITNPTVLSAALNDPQVAALGRIRQSLDPEAELRQDIHARIQSKTDLIVVSMASPEPREAATIVNAVVKAYLEKNREQYDRQSAELKAQFEMLQRELERESQAKTAELKRLYSKHGPLGQLDVLGGDSGSASNPEQYVRNQHITLDEYIRLSQRVDALEDRLFLAKQELGRKRIQRSMDQPPAETQLEMAVQEALAQDQDLRGLRQKYYQYQDAIKNAERVARKPNDASVLGLRKQLRDLEQSYQSLSEQKRATYRANLARGQTNSTLDQEIRQAETDIQRLEDQRDYMAGQLKELKVQVKDEKVDALDQSLVMFEWRSIREKQAKVSAYLDQIEFELQQTRPRIVEESPARPNMMASTKKRWALMGAGPLGVLVALLALFTLLEVRAARVADPDELPGRVRLGVIGVVPPLPSNRGLLGRHSPEKIHRQVAEFMQSLDHLRVVLCAGGQVGIGAEHRVVLITSACSGEGKTTLAAQLAGRCANAGLSTLLIDADLRRPQLAELLEVPDGPGLADVLAGEVEPEAAMLVIGNAGGFHLLPAGTMGHDPSRLLQGERLGQLMERLRVSFDVVLVDAPPVLAVPDALLIGRWTDGAVLTVRHDISRFPLIDRAHRRLAVVGVPVLGAVINGVRSPESAYSTYGYAYTGNGSSLPSPSPQPDNLEY